VDTYSLFKHGYSKQYDHKNQLRRLMFDPVRAFAYLIHDKYNSYIQYFKEAVISGIYENMYVDMSHVFAADFVDISVDVDDEKDLRLLFHLVIKDPKYGYHIYGMLKRGELVADGYRDRIEATHMWDLNKLQKIFKLKNNAYSEYINNCNK